MDITVLHKSPCINNWTDDKEKNPKLVETAGFIPLEVKFKQFEQNGIRANFTDKDFDSSDYRDLYLSPNATIYPDDDLEDVMEKLSLQAQIRANIMKNKVSKPVETDERSEEVQTGKEKLKDKEKNDE